MRRKLVKHGAATLMVSLPRKWCKANHLDKGNEVNIEEAESNLLISAAGATKEKKEAEITLTTSIESAIRTMLVYSYRLGYDQIKVNFSSDLQFKIVQNTIKTRLLGFDIIKKEKDYCIIENITEPLEDQFENLFQKVFMNISEMIEITKKRLEGKEPAEDYESVEERINQYDNFCRRVVSKKRFERKSLLFWDFSIRMIHAQRELYFLNKYLDKNKIAASKDALDFLNDISKNFEMIMDSYNKKEIQPLEKIHEREKEILNKKRYSLIESKKGKEEAILYHLFSCERNVYLSSSALMGLLIH